MESDSINNHDSSDPLLGSVLDDRFQIISPLGQGSSSKVYRARHLMLDQNVAVKILSAGRTESEKNIRRFKNEATILSKFDHPNILKFHAFGTTPGGSFYLVTELIEGETLETMLKRVGTLDQDTALPIFLDICKALEYAHANGVIHRDIKPSNVMIIQNEEMPSAKILDFGILKNTDAADQKLTETGYLLGTADYMSPEQCRGEKLDFRSDIYSLGNLMFESVVGKPPHRGESDLATMQNQVNQPVDTVPAQSAISNDLACIILKCLQKDPDERFASIEELAKVLETAENSAARKRTKRPVYAVPATIVAIISIFMLLSSLNTKHPAHHKSVHKKPTVLNEFTVSQYEDWIADNLNNKSMSPIKLAEEFCRVQEEHLTDSVPGSLPIGKEIISKLKKYINETDNRATPGSSKSDRRLQGLYYLATLELDCGELNRFEDTVESIKQPCDDNEGRDASLNNYCYTWARLAALRGENTMAAELSANSAELMRQRGNKTQQVYSLCQETEWWLKSRNIERATETAEQSLDLISSSLNQDNFIIPHVMLDLSLPGLDQVSKPGRIAELINRFYPDKVISAYCPPLPENACNTDEELIYSRIEQVRDYRRAGKHDKSEALSKELETRLFNLCKKYDAPGGKESPTNPTVNVIALLWQNPQPEIRLNELLQTAMQQLKPERQIKLLHAIFAIASTYDLPVDKLVVRANQLLAENDSKVPAECCETRLLFGSILQNSGKLQQAMEQLGQAVIDMNKKPVSNADLRLAAYTELMATLVRLNKIDEAEGVSQQIRNENIFDKATSDKKFNCELYRGMIAYKKNKTQGRKLHESLYAMYKSCPLNKIEKFDVLATTLADEYGEKNDNQSAINCLTIAAKQLLSFRSMSCPQIGRVLSSLQKYCKKVSDDDLLNWTNEQIKINDKMARILQH